VNQNIDKPRILQAVHSVELPGRATSTYNLCMERKIFWILFTLLSTIAGFLLPIWWGLAATVPCLFIAWWVAYRSDWF
jgi:hypothetical protein